jgi:hypothetical protein
MKRLSLVCLFLAFKAQASLYSELSSLEKDLVDDALANYGLVSEENPENKRIKNIYIFTGQPFDKDVKFFSLLNHLHINTKDNLIKASVFHKPQDIYDESVVKDSELALRRRSQVRSIAVIVPVSSKNLLKDEVDLLIATKDLLSLNLQLNFSGSAANITNFLVGVAENNFLGLNKSISAKYELEQGTHLFSGNYFDPNLFSSNWQLLINESVLFLRDGFSFDGVLTDVRIGKPLLSQTDRWGYGLSFKAGSRTVFDFKGAKLRTFQIATENSKKKVERVYHYSYGSGSLLGTYSLGTAYKKEFSFGYGFNLKRPSVLKKSELSIEEEQVFKDQLLPRDEFESFITLGFSYFHNQFLTLYDYNNFKVQETLRTGPSFSLTNEFAAKPLLSDYNFFRPKVSFSFLQTFGTDSFMSAQVSTSNRFDGGFSDNNYRFFLGLVSPTIYFGRAILSGTLAQTFNNRDNQGFVVGSDSGLRGVESRFYLGKKAFSGNFEIRSKPLDLWIIHTGLTCFYDVGAAFDDWQDANATHAIGFGIRILAPQLSSLPFRFDLAFPIYGLGTKYHTVVPSFGIGQAF